MGHESSQRLLRFDLVTLDASRRRRRESDGALIVPGRFARIGCQTYLEDDGAERVEYRPEDEVRASAATFSGVSVTDLHPQHPAMVSPETWQRDARGHLENPHFEDGWLLGDFVIQHQGLIDAIERGERSELSAGYYADFDPTPGEYEGQRYHGCQRGIVGNHVAALPAGTARAGREARLLLDSTSNQLPPGSRRRGEETHMDEYEIQIGGVPFKVHSDATTRKVLEDELRRAAGLDKRLSDLAARADSAESAKLASDQELARAKGQLLAAEAKTAELSTALADARDPRHLDERARVRAELIDAAVRLGVRRSDLVGKDREPKTDREIRVLALRAAGIKADASASEDFISGALEMALRYQRDREESGEVTVRDLLDRVDGGDVETADPCQVLWDAHDRELARQGGEED